MSGGAWTRPGERLFVPGLTAVSTRGALPFFCARRWLVGLLCMFGAMLFGSQQASAAPCPAPIKNKPNSIPHVDYAGIQHLSFCYGPVTVKPGQNIIRLNPTNLFPQRPGYITRFDPELIYANGNVPRVDVLHLHHAVWLVNGGPSSPPARRSHAEEPGARHLHLLLPGPPVHARQLPGREQLAGRRPSCLPSEPGLTLPDR